MAVLFYCFLQFLLGIWGAESGSVVSGIHNLAKSITDVLVADIILAIVPQDGQRGVPSDENCLLLLNVVESRPLSFARPEQVKPFNWASLEMAFHSNWWVMFLSFGLCILFLYCCKWNYS